MAVAWLPTCIRTKLRQFFLFGWQVLERAVALFSLDERPTSSEPTTTPTAAATTTATAAATTTPTGGLADGIDDVDGIDDGSGTSIRSFLLRYG